MSSSTDTTTVCGGDLEERRRQLTDRYRQVRSFSDQIVKPLHPEDCVIQSMPDVSPTRWHLAHTTWFFETFVLKSDPAYVPYDDRFGYLFNSYYNTVGQQFPRANRGLLSRPTVAEVLEYRQHVDRQLLNALQSDAQIGTGELDVIQLGLHHEQQHQELMLTDIKHVLSCNPLHPAYQEGSLPDAAPDHDQAWVCFPEGLREIGHRGQGFAFDNESPRHKVFQQAFEIATTPVSAGQFLEFIEDHGYQRPELWLSLGWAQVQQHQWQAPLYWQQSGDGWMQFTLSGLQELVPAQPVCHISYFEADAFARWSQARLPTEAEWEVASETTSDHGPFADDLLQRGQAIHPTTSHGTASELKQFLGGVWEWTSSSYAAYPGYRAPQGALGEYNGKFMCNQYVLRGGSCATPSQHVRRTYRNFFPPETRWQFSGLRLARDSA